MSGLREERTPAGLKARRREGRRRSFGWARFLGEGTVGVGISRATIFAMGSDLLGALAPWRETTERKAFHGR